MKIEDGGGGGVEGDFEDRVEGDFEDQGLI